MMYEELVYNLRIAGNRKSVSKYNQALVLAAAGVIEELSKRVPPIPHGDLIDRDKAVQDLRMDYAYAAAKIVALQSIVVPAEPLKEEAL